MMGTDEEKRFLVLTETFLSNIKHEFNTIGFAAKVVFLIIKAVMLIDSVK